MGLFPDENINWYQKLTCDDPKPSLSFCLPIVATVAKGRGKSIISFDGCHAPPALWVCSTSSFVDLLPKAPQGKSKSSARLKKIKKKYFIYIFQKTPRWKNCSKLGVARDCHALPLSWWWLTDWGPRVSKWWWVWILTQIDTGSQFPRGESPPRQPPLSPLWKGQGSQDAPRGSHRFCSESVKYHLHAADYRHPPFKNDSSASRKDTLLHLILSLLSQASAKWILYQGYIFHYKILVFYILHIRHYYLPLPIPYYKTYVIHGIIAHKQTNLFLWLEYVF